MAGRRRRREVHAALTALAAEAMPVDDGEEPATAMDFIIEWAEQGKTLTALAEKLTQLVGYSVHRSFILKVMRDEHDDFDERLATARTTEAAHSLVDEAQDIIDAPAVTREQLQRAKQRADFRQWRAKTLAPNDYGDRKTVDVNINLPAAHLAALRKVNAERALGAGEMQRVGRARDAAPVLSASVPNDETVVEAVFEDEA